MYEVLVTGEADLSAILGAVYRRDRMDTLSDVVENRAAYVWDRQISLSPNAVDYLLSVLVCDTWPEAHEAGLHAELMRRLREIKEV